MEKWITIYGIVAILSATIAAFLAYRKNRNANSWFASTFLFPPSLIPLIFMGKSKNGPYRPQDDDDDGDLRDLWSEPRD